MSRIWYQQRICRFRVILVQCLPCILVTIFNGYLILALRKAHKVSEVSQCVLQYTCKYMIICIIYVYDWVAA